MGLWVKTTVEVSDPLLQDAKEVATREGVTLRALFEEGLRLLLSERAKADQKRERVVLTVSKATGGTLPGVDLIDSRNLEDLMNS
jgi:hypothetical protein